MTTETSAEECRSKWQNVRTCYRRNLRNKAVVKGYVKTYYLLPYLHFLEPYTKMICEQPEDIEVSSRGDHDYAKTSVSHEYTASGGSNLLIKNEDFAEDGATSSKTPVSKCEQDDKGGIRDNKLKTVEPISSKDSCDLFLMSIAPRMRALTQKKQLRLQIGILNLIDEMSENTSQ